MGEQRYGLHPLLQQRWSPSEWDPAHVLTPADVDQLLDAARWAPSAGNSQPWSFAPARRGDSVHVSILPHLAGSSARWAPHASLLVVNICHRFVEGTDWDYSEFAQYDLGQAVAHLSIQAQAMGLHTRQFAAFDRAGLQRELQVPEHWVAMTMTAVGRSAATMGHGRGRRDLTAITWPPAATASSTTAAPSTPAPTTGPRAGQT